MHSQVGALEREKISSLNLSKRVNYGAELSDMIVTSTVLVTWIFKLFYAFPIY
jgi:hypothetical protein